MRQGFSGFSPPRLAGDVYIVHAVNEDGARVRLVIDAYDGRILRPVRAVERLAPGRPIGQLGHREGEDDIGSEDLGPRRPWERGALLPPRPVPRVSPPDPFTSREARIETPSVDPEPRPAASPQKPGANRRTSRVEQPARERAAPTPPAKQREAVRQNPGATPAAPAAKPERAGGREPSVTAAVPTPAAPKETPPASPAAPPPAKSAAERPDAPPSGPTSEQPPALAPAEAAHTASGGPVRVIEGVTPVLPQDAASPEQ